MRSAFVTLGAALLLVACGQPPSGSASGAVQVQILSIPSQVAKVTLELHGDDAATAPDSKTYTLPIQNGAASLTLPNIAKGHYTLTARGFDNADGAIVLYKGAVSLDIESDAPIAFKMNRTTSAVTVNASGVSAKNNVLVAKVGGLQARLIASGGTATGTLQGVPTGRNLNVLVEGRDTSGALVQQGGATLDLSEQDQTVAVNLSDVQAAAPVVTAVSGPSSVKKNESYSLRVQADAGSGQTFTGLKIEWGDGSVDTPGVSGSSLDASYSHTYSAAGNQTVTVTVTNSAGLSATGSTGVTVIDTASPTVTVDTGAEVVPVTLTANGIPAGTERVQAVVDAPPAAQSVRKQDLKAEYLLELAPNPDGSWTGALGLPAGFTYSVSLRVTSGGQTSSGAAQSITTSANGSNSFTLSYTPGGNTPNCPAATITNVGAVQGSGASSPLLGQTVTVRGTVTLDAQSGLGGFFLQDVAPDGNPATSDGLYVYTGSAPQSLKAGDVVQLTGTVQEYKGKTDTDSVTELGSVSGFSDCGAGTLPAPTTLHFPLKSASDLEAVEGVLVTVPDTLTVTNNYGLGRYGELGLSSGGLTFTPTNGQGGDAATNALRYITIDDAVSAQNPPSIPFLDADHTRRTGDTVSNLTGVVQYANNLFSIEPTVAPSFVNANPRKAAPDPVGGSLRVGGANVLNFFTQLLTTNEGCTTAGTAPDSRGANDCYEFLRQRDKVVSDLNGLNADVIALSEVENNGDTTLQYLVDSLNAVAGAGTYKPILTGTIGTDVIKTAIIYKPARVQPIGSYVVDNADVFVKMARTPLAQTFRDLGTDGVFTVIANHFKSKGSCPSSGDVDMGQGCWNMLRTQQAQELLKFAGQMQQQSGDQDVLLMGDFNSYGAEDPINTIVAGGYESLNKRIPAADRYSYQFGGAFGYLDHALASSNLSSQVTGITEWHINSDEPTFLDYNTEYKNSPDCKTSTCTTPDYYTPDAFRASDHDPVVVGLALSKDAGTAPSFRVSASGAQTATAGQPYGINISASSAPDSLKVNWGDGTGDMNLDVNATTASHTYAAIGSYTVTVTGVKGSDTKTATVSVTVAAAQTSTEGLVISGVYGGGGNSGATYKNDYVELFNASQSAISLSGKSIQYASATGSFSALNVLNLPDGSVQPGHYYLIQLAAGTGTAPNLPTPDATGSLNLGATAGKLVLANGTAPVSGHADSSVLDFVGYGGANDSETSPTPALSNSTAASRNGGGCADTNNNGADFTTGTPAPRNSASAANLCAP